MWLLTLKYKEFVKVSKMELVSFEINLKKFMGEDVGLVSVDNFT